MDTLNKVYSKLNSDNKTELAKHKIELSISSDARAEMFKIYEKTSSNSDKLIEELENNKKRVNRQIGSLEKTFSKVTNVYKKVTSEIQNKAKELGVAPNDVPDFAKFQKAYFFLQDRHNETINSLKEWK